MRAMFRAMRDKALLHTALLVMNVVVIAAIIGVVFIAKWVGWEACAGATFGFLYAQLGFRLTRGRWWDD